MERTSIDNLLNQIDHALGDEISTDAMRWTPVPARAVGPHGGYAVLELAVDTSAFDAAIDRARAQIAEAMDMLGQQVRAIQIQAAQAKPRIDRLHDTLAAKPIDTRERALWIRQHRNTGPTAPRLDGRRR